MGAADGLLVNGSVNNGAATPFAQFPAFGNNRRRPGSVYNGGFGVLTGNSMWDARPYSFSAQETPKPSYYDVHLIGTFGGPVKIPGVVRNNPTMFIGVQRTADHNATTQSARMPTALERRGDFSQTRDALGLPVQIADPVTGLPFPGGVIPQARISPQAAALLGYYPAPNLIADGRFNYQAPVLNAVTQYSLQSRLTQPVNTRNHLFGTLAYQRTGTDTTSLFGFEDRREVSAIDAAANWSHRISQFLSIRTRYQLTRTTTNVTPYFAGRTNVSGDAGITGNNQEPDNWGPPNLNFAGGIAGMSDIQRSTSRNQNNSISGSLFWSRAAHNFTFGGDFRRLQFNQLSQQDARGTFTFTGAAAGNDFAGFLLGVPDTSSIAFGNADKYFRSSTYDGYFNDDWRFNPALTINGGLRWEYNSPITEKYGRLVNLDIAPGYSAIAPVVAASATGPLTGNQDSAAAAEGVQYEPATA
jgi:outer membrane receptor protein involved in Fe transport